MASYRFKRECKVYLVRNAVPYKIEVYPDLGFSQTFDEKAIGVKTLHDQSLLFEDAVINKANPANFEFTVMLTKGTDFDVLGDLLTDTTTDGGLTTFDVYVDTGSDTYKIEKCVFERATFQITRDSIVTVSLSGTGSRLDTNAELANPPAMSPTALDAVTPGLVEVTLDGQVLDNLTSISLELVNEIQWLEYDTLHKSLNVLVPSDTMYPEAFVVPKKVLSGTIQQYVQDNNTSRTNTWSTNSTLRIRVGGIEGVYYLDINMPSVVWTNRIEPEDVFVQTYDFRINHNPTNLKTVINY